MLFRSLLGLSMLCYCILSIAQVPEVELVTYVDNDPFMPQKLYRARTEENPRHQLRAEKRLRPDYKGQFISLVQSQERLLYHPIFSQFGNIEIYLTPTLIHYGVPLQFDNEQALNKFIDDIISPRTEEYTLLYLKNGRETKKASKCYAP